MVLIPGHLPGVRSRAGDVTTGEPVLVRVHVQDTLGDVLGVDNKRLGWPLRAAIERVAQEGRGVIVVLRYPESPRHFVNEVDALRSPIPELHANKDGGQVLRTYGTGSQIISDLGVTRMRVLSAPKQMHAISGFGLEVVEYIER